MRLFYVVVVDCYYLFLSFVLDVLLLLLLLLLFVITFIQDIYSYIPATIHVAGDIILQLFCTCNAIAHDKHYVLLH